MATQKILLIDDEIEIRGFLQDYFEDREYQVFIASDGLEGLALCEKEDFDLVICDMLMPKMIGTEFLKRLKNKKPGQRVIMMTGVKEESMMEKAKALGCLHYLTKPILLSDLAAKVSECLAS